MLTRHIEQRTRQRCPGGQPEQLWAVGRKPTSEEFVEFHTYPRPDVEYRISVFQGRKWFLAMGKSTKQLITVFSR